MEFEKTEYFVLPFERKEDKENKNSLSNYHVQDTVLVPYIRFHLNFKITWYLHYITYFKQVKNWSLVLY